MYAARYSCLRLGELTFAGDAFMRFVRALDAILTLQSSVRKNLDHFENTTWRIPTDCRRDGNNISNLEFVEGHQFPLSGPITVNGHLNSIDATLTGAHAAQRPDPRRCGRICLRTFDNQRSGPHELQSPGVSCESGILRAHGFRIKGYRCESKLPRSCATVARSG
jgi:hypothetical protein